MNKARHRHVSGRYSPLRYPGGKGKLAGFVKQLMLENQLCDGLYVEPYAGGAAVAIELLLTEVASRIAINDVSPHVFSFWSSVLTATDDLCALTMDTPVTVEHWDRQKRIMMNPAEHGELELGFATFFLNRTNRSGILNGGIIGGRAQSGQWKIDARYNGVELIERIQSIAKLSQRIRLTQMDAVDFLEHGAKTWDERTLVYLDPPYYVKGRGLYYHYYRHNDHVSVSRALLMLKNQKWIVSYDAAAEIREIYSGHPSLTYSIGYSAREHTSGEEIMFFGPGVKAPQPQGSMVERGRSAQVA